MSSVTRNSADSPDVAADYATVRQGVGILDRSDHGLLEVTGRDRASFLHALVSNEVKALGPGQGCAATLLDIHGKVQFVLFLWVLEDKILIVTPPGTAAEAMEAFDKYLFSEKAFFRDATGELALPMLAGASAAALAERLAGARPGEAPWSSVPGKIDGAAVVLVRGGGETGADEVWIVAPASDKDGVWRAAVAAGARPIGGEVLETLRIEAGTPRFGVDVDATVLLPEIPFASLLSHSKGCYPGQEVVVRIRDRGHVNRLLRGLVVEGDALPARGAEVSAGGAVIGHVTSATRSPGLGRAIALAFVRRQHAEAGAPVTVRVGERDVPATVSDLPFVR
jgi:folate-binding protein YgfZ